MQGSLSRKVVSNTFFNVFGNLFATVVSFFLTPYIVSHVGVEKYGVWSVATMLVGSITLLDPGLSLAFVRFITAAYTKHDHDGLSRIVSTGMLFYTLFAAAALIAGYLLAGPAQRWFGIDPAAHPEARAVFLTLIVAFGLSTSCSILGTLHMGLMRMEYSFVSSAFASLLYGGLVALSLRAGGGLRGMADSQFATVAATCALNLWIAYRILPALVLRPFRLFDRGLFREMLAFGFKIQFAQFARIVIFNIDKTLIGLLLSVTFVSYYQFGSAVALAVLMLISMPVSTLTPAFVEIETLGDRPRLVDAYRMTLKYTGLFAAPAFAYTLVSADHLMAIWMGAGDFRSSAAVIRILSVGYTASVLGFVPSQLCVALNRPDLITRYSALIIATNAAMSYLLIRCLGFPWVAVGTAAGMVAGAVYIAGRANGMLCVPAATILPPLARTLAAAAAGALAVHAIDAFAAGFGLTPSGALAAAGRLAMTAALAVRAACFTAVFLLAGRALCAFDRGDIEYARAKAREFLSRVGNAGA